MLKSISEITAIIESTKTRSAWSAGVKEYALELLADLPQNVDYGTRDSMNADLLNGAQNWKQYSWCGSALIYNEDIAQRLCTPSELKKTRNGERRPNAREEWLDVQARALYQAANNILRIAFGGQPLF